MMRLVTKTAFRRLLAWLIGAVLFASCVFARLGNEPFVRVDWGGQTLSNFSAIIHTKCLMLGLSWLGSRWVLCGLALIVITPKVIRRQWRDATEVSALVLSSGLMTLALKVLFVFPRPITEYANKFTDGFSFPSGHTLASTAILPALSRLQFGSNRIALGGSFILVAAIGMSRISLGAHYASDVIAGMLCGIALRDLLSISFGEGRRVWIESKPKCRS